MNVKSPLYGALISLCLWSGAVQASESLFQNIQQADSKAVETLIGQDASLLEVRDSRGNTPLLAAAQMNNVPLVKLLLAKGADPSAMNYKHRDILNAAVSVGNPEIARLALQAGADPTQVTSVYEGSALIYATHQAELEIMELLIAAGAPLDRVNNLGWTALLEAVILGDGGEDYVSAVRLLLAAGADRNISDKKGKTPLDHARDKGYQALITVLENSTDE